MRELFPQRNLGKFEYVAGNIRTQLDFYYQANPKSTNYGLETLRHLAPFYDPPSLGIFRERVVYMQMSIS